MAIAMVKALRTNPGPPSTVDDVVIIPGAFGIRSHAGFMLSTLPPLQGRPLTSHP